MFFFYFKANREHDRIPMSCNGFRKCFILHNQLITLLITTVRMATNISASIDSLPTSSPVTDLQVVSEPVDSSPVQSTVPTTTSTSTPDNQPVCDTALCEDITDPCSVGASLFEQPPKQPVPTDRVFNLSDLFSGELEKRRKREAKKLFSKSKRFKSSHKQSDADVSSAEKPVPNYFVAVQISNSKIKEALQKVQDTITSRDKKLSGAVTSVRKLHLTLMVLCLKTEEDMLNSKIALDNAAHSLWPVHSKTPLSLDISGLGHFRNQVVFAKVKGDNQRESLSHIASVVEESFLNQQLVPPDKKGFKPHATIMKLSQLKGKQKRAVKKIDSTLYEEFVDTDFGSDVVNTLQLCAMGKPKDKQGYYHVEYSARFGKSFTGQDLAETDSSDTENAADTMDDTEETEGLVEMDTTGNTDNVLTETLSLNCVDSNTDTIDNGNENIDISSKSGDKNFVSEIECVSNIGESDEDSIQVDENVDESVSEDFETSIEDIVTTGGSIGSLNKIKNDRYVQDAAIADEIHEVSKNTEADKVEVSDEMSVEEDSVSLHSKDGEMIRLS